ncbi:MAG: nucleotide exchange factor GrpE [Bacteroidales bacterium]|nr:nucleotide exchange factor GrpE [Bacteroidales bacterium]
MDDVSFEEADNSNQDEQGQDHAAEDKKPSAKKSSKHKKDKAEKEIEALEEKNQELNDKYLRLYSEFDNYRKRTQKERLELLKNASQDIITELLPVLDDFDRAMKSFSVGQNNEESLKGIELIYNKLLNSLTQKGLEPMNAMGKDFDTDFHEAITNIPAADESQKGKVVDVIQKGYLLNGKIIRFAKVVVGS